MEKGREREADSACEGERETASAGSGPEFERSLRWAIEEAGIRASGAGDALCRFLALYAHASGRAAADELGSTLVRALHLHAYVQRARDESAELFIREKGGGIVPLELPAQLG